MLEREISVVGSCEGCFFYLSNPKKGEIRCKRSATLDYEDINCVEYDAVNPHQLVYYILKEVSDEKQNETMAP